MVLEATLVCVDNSEWSRNGDFAPSRFEAQQDAANLICSVKTNAHIENAVGILTMAGDRIDVRVTPTSDVGQIFAGLDGVKIRGQADLVRAIQTAQLALKHRLNKNQKQRIVCFVASPVTADKKQLETVGKQLKKNNVALDIISFGEVEANSEKLRALHGAVNSNDTSHLVECPSGAGQLLSDMVLTSPVVRYPEQEGGGGVGAAGEGGEAVATAAGGPAGGVNQFGVDPNVDPDLYMALRISLEEEQARSQRETASKEATDTTVAASSFSAAAAAPITASAPAARISGDIEIEGPPPDATSGRDTDSSLHPAVPTGDDIEMDEQLREALLLSMQDYKSDIGGTAEPTGREALPTEGLASSPSLLVEGATSSTPATVAIITTVAASTATPLPQQQRAIPSQTAAAELGNTAISTTIITTSTAPSTAESIPSASSSFAYSSSPSSVSETATASSSTAATTDTTNTTTTKAAISTTTPSNSFLTSYNTTFSTSSASCSSSSSGASFSDPGFVQQMLQSLPGVNVSDERIQAAIRATGQGEPRGNAEHFEEGKKKKEEEEEKDNK